jgi:hypothetical protein
LTFYFLSKKAKIKRYKTVFHLNFKLVSLIKRTAEIEVLEKRELGRIVGTKRNEVIVGLTT